MYFDYRNYLFILRRALGEKITHPRRRKIVWGILLLYPFLAVFDWIFFALDHVFYPGFRSVQVRAPIFVLGNARSGTTHTQRLLAGDADRFSYFRTWEILLPSIVQRKLVRAIGRFDERFLGGRIAAKVFGKEDATLGKARRMHDWRLTGAEEDGFLSLHTFGSGTLNVIFPYGRELAPLNDLDTLASPRHREQWLDFYEGCVKRQLYWEGCDRTFISKNPGFSKKVRSLRARFPDARFIFPVRHPAETTPSLVNMLVKGWRAMGCDEDDVQDSAEWLKGNQVDAFAHAFEFLDTLPDSDTATVTFQELISEPRAAVEKIYTRFGFDISEEYAAFLDGEQARSRAYESQHRYDADALGIPRALVRERLGHLYERFGWPLDED
jgi:hypothetical protein